ncbi:hypothetical protein RIVM261_033080 [Rivularia sp. IAM M-261]|nr:hypothetical protein CAL7716_092990 [Calothrix sp. PCC 7716]GJD18352.1 hypothetical protein RIVM261_033080 [Rivularia sp. IAM M-261]
MKTSIQIMDIEATYLVEISEEKELQDIHGGDLFDAAVEAVKFVYEVGKDVGCAIRKLWN